MQQLSEYAVAWESPEKTIEKLLVKETPVSVLRRFLKNVKDRADYPSGVAKIATGMPDGDVSELAEKVLLARKGDAGGYGALLIEQCKGVAELPQTIRAVLEAIHERLSPTVSATGG